MDDVAVKVTDLHKEFVLPQHKNSSVKQSFVNIVRKNGKVTQKVLDGVSFEVKKGDFFGIVGRNGSGKSTLLKILAGVYAPTSGGVEMNGKLTPFIELGVGFNPELSGRDNVFLNGALLGFTHKQMESMYDEIVEFAELEPFMDQKLKNYSSGMQVRLAFSIAIKAKNEILIFDEVLAVGDEAFQQKCLRIFEEYKAQKQTIILVTHDMETVKRFCSRAMLLHEGKILAIGSPFNVADQYSELNLQDRQVTRNQNTSVRAEILDATSKPSRRFKYGDKLSIEVSWPKELGVMNANVLFFRTTGEYVFGTSTFDQNPGMLQATDRVKFDVDLDINSGNYRVEVGLFGKTNKETIDYLPEGPEFEIERQKTPTWSGLFKLNGKWHI